VSAGRNQRLVHVEGIAECAPHAAKVDTGLAQVSGSRSRQAWATISSEPQMFGSPPIYSCNSTVVIGPLNLRIGKQQELVSTLIGKSRTMCVP